MKYTFIILGWVWAATIQVFAHLDPFHPSPSGVKQRRQAPLLSPADIPSQCVSACSGISRDIAACPGPSDPRCICTGQFLQVDLPPCVNCVAGVNPSEQAPLQSGVDSIINGCRSAGFAIPPINITVTPNPNVGNIPPAGPAGGTGLATGTTVSTGSAVAPTSASAIIGSSGGTVGSPGGIGLTDTLTSSTADVESSIVSPSSTLSIAAPSADSTDTGVLLPGSTGGNAAVKASWSGAAVLVIVGINALFVY